MIIFFDTRTGNNRRFADQLLQQIDSLGLSEQLTIQQLQPSTLVEEPFVCITYTTGMGMVPATTSTFLEANHSYLHGIAASGNKIWGDNFAISADKLARLYRVPLLHKWEMSGMPEDVEIFMERVQKIKL